MKLSTCANTNTGSLNVFDFHEEDELPQHTSKFINKTNSLSADEAMLKYNFLQCVAQGGNDHTEEIGSASCIDVELLDIDQCPDDGNLCRPSETVGEDCGSKKENLGSQYDSTSNGHHLLSTRIDDEGGSVSSEVETKSSHEKSQIGNGELNGVVSESHLDDDRVDMNLDTHESMSESSPSTSASNCVNNDCVQPLSYCFDGWEMDDNNIVVNLSPDFMVLQDIYCTDAQISFSSSFIQIQGSLTHGNEGSFNYQWGIDDIVDLECHWYERTETAMVKLHVISEDVAGGSDVLGPSGVQEWIFSVADSNWPNEQDKIISLNVKYKAIWNVLIDNDTEMDEEALLEQNNILSEKHFFPNFDQPFEDVIYPHGDSDPVSLSKRDADLLQPETFINDTIVDFYIKYLRNKIPAEERHRFHFFNSFFFRKLVNLDKDPFTASEGRTAFLRVRKWTRKVNLFEKDYIFIPINFNLHWSLIVICHPGEVTNFKDEVVENTVRVPCILHMDSIKGMHAGLKNHIQSYLWEEWKEKQNEVSDEMYLKFRMMRFIRLELPQQENSFDCGLFLLHYVELFLEEAPDNFSPFKITKFSSFLNVDWFPPTEASLKRAPILNLIYDILQNLSRETSDCDEEHEFTDDRHNKNEAGVELISDSFKPSEHCHEDLLSCQTSQGIQMTLLEASSTQNSEYLDEKGLVVREFFDPDASAVLDGQFQVFYQAAHLYQYKNPLPPIEEDTETGEQFVYSPSGRPVSRGFGPQASYSGVPSQAEQQCDNSSSDRTNSASDNGDSCEEGSLENNSYEEDKELRPIDNSDQQRSPSMENIVCSLASACSELPEVAMSENNENIGNVDDNDYDAVDGDEDQAGDGNGDHAGDGDVAGVEDEDQAGGGGGGGGGGEYQAGDGEEGQAGDGGEDQAGHGDEVQAEEGDEDFAHSIGEEHHFLPIYPSDIADNDEKIECRDDLWLVKHDEQSVKRRRLTVRSEEKGLWRTKSL